MRTQKPKAYVILIWMLLYPLMIVPQIIMLLVALTIGYVGNIDPLFLRILTALPFIVLAVSPSLVPLGYAVFAYIKEKGHISLIVISVLMSVFLADIFTPSFEVPSVSSFIEAQNTKRQIQFVKDNHPKDDGRSILIYSGTHEEWYLDP